MSVHPLHPTRTLTLTECPGPDATLDEQLAHVQAGLDVGLSALQVSAARGVLEGLADVDRCARDMTVSEGDREVPVEFSAFVALLGSNVARRIWADILRDEIRLRGRVREVLAACLMRDAGARELRLVAELEAVIGRLDDILPGEPS